MAGGPGNAAYWLHKGSHAALGCATASAKGGDCASGAFGGVAGEVFAEQLGKTGMSDKWLLASSRIATVFSAGAAGKDINDADAIASNAVQNNYLKHDELKEMKTELDKCKSFNCLLSKKKYYSELSKKNDLMMQTDCAIGAASCAQHIADAQIYVYKNPILLQDDVKRSRSQFLDTTYGLKDGAQYFENLEKRRMFYGIVSDEFKAKDIDSVWPAAAEGVVIDLESSIKHNYEYSKSFFFIDEPTREFIKEGNQSIFEDAFEQMGDVLDKGPSPEFDGPDWDQKMVRREQNIIQKVLDKKAPITRKEIIEDLDNDIQNTRINNFMYQFCTLITSCSGINEGGFDGSFGNQKDRENHGYKALKKLRNKE